MWDNTRNGVYLWERRHPWTSVNIWLSELQASLPWTFLSGVHVECCSYSPPPRLRLTHQSLITRQETPRCKRLIVSFNTRKDSLECESLARIMCIFLPYLQHCALVSLLPRSQIWAQISHSPSAAHHSKLSALAFLAPELRLSRKPSASSSMVRSIMAAPSSARA
jgi:hypothetical protein